jgi:hypothetical protein
MRGVWRGFGEEESGEERGALLASYIYFVTYQYRSAVGTALLMLITYEMKFDPVLVS